MILYRTDCYNRNWSLIELIKSCLPPSYSPSFGGGQGEDRTKAYGLLVLLGYDITAFTPIAYQRGNLPRPLKRNLILWWVSRLYAFSAYPFPTQLLCNALSRTTDTPEVSPTRSSRTRVRSTQISNARYRQRPNCLTTF